jgi:hypothetical protein
VENVSEYIAGYVVAKVTKKTKCVTCQEQLVGEKMPILSNLKKRGPYLAPAKDVSDICAICEKIIRQYSLNLLKNNVKEFLINKIFSYIGVPFSNKIIDDHVEIENFFDNKNLLNNHRTELCKSIINLYLDARLFYECKKTEKKRHFTKEINKTSVI